MVKTREMGTNKSWHETLHDLARLFAEWGVESGDWRAQQILAGVTVTYFFPYDPLPRTVSCYGQKTAAQNLRVCYGRLESNQVAGLRGVSETYAGATLLLLPAGSPQEAKDMYSESAPRPRASRVERGVFRNLREACQYLGVVPDAPEEVVNAVYRARAKKAAGEVETMRKLNAARDFIYERNAWVTQREAVET